MYERHSTLVSMVTCLVPISIVDVILDHKEWLITRAGICIDS